MPQTARHQATRNKSARRRESNALTLLKSDHEEVSESFERYEKARSA